MNFNLEVIGDEAHHAGRLNPGNLLELRLPLIDHQLVAAVGRLNPSLRFAHGQKTLLKAIAMGSLDFPSIAWIKRIILQVTCKG